MSREVITQLKALKHADINPSQEWLQNNRALLLSQMKNTVRPDTQSVIEKFTQYIHELFLHSSIKIVRPVALVVLIALAAGVGRVAVTQASQALPGDFLYGLKRTTEKTQVAVASVVADENQLVKLHLDLANRRADEVKQVIKKNPERTAAVQVAVNDLKQELQTTTQKLDSLKNQTASSVKNTVTNVQSTTDAIKNTLQDVKINLQTSTSSIDKNLSQNISDAKELAKDTGVATVQVAIESHLHGDLSKEDVTKVINNTLQSVAADADQSQKNVAGVKDTVNQISTSTLPTTTVSTTTIKIISNEALQATEQTQVAQNQIDQKINEVKALVAQGGDLNQVASKVKEAAEASTVVEKISDKTIQNLQVLLPQVQILPTGEITSTTASGTIIIATGTPGVKITGVTTSILSSTLKNVSASITSSINATSSIVTSSKPTTTSKLKK
jgi:hypothetical protein